MAEPRSQAGAVDQLPSGRWRVRVTLPGGKRISPTGRTYDTKDEADTALKVHFAHRTLGIHLDPQMGGEPLKAVYARMLPTLGGKTGTKADRTTFQRRVMTGEAKPVKAGCMIGDLPVGSISLSGARTWAQALHVAGYPRATIDKWWGMLDRTLAYAVSENLVRSNPLTGAKHTVSERATSKPHYLLNLTEVVTLTLTAVPDRALMTEVLLWTGMRQAEVRALVGRSLRRERRAIHIDGAISPAEDRKGKPVLIRDVPKSRAGGREVPVPGPIFDALCALADRIKDPTKPLFPNQFGEWQSTTAVTSAWAESAQRAGLVGSPGEEMPGRRRPPTPHDARSTYASWMSAAGIPVAAAQQHLGHTNAAMTTDVYTEVEHWLSDHPVIRQCRVDGVGIREMVDRLYAAAWDGADAVAGVFDADPTEPRRTGGRPKRKPGEHWNSGWEKRRGQPDS